MPNVQTAPRLPGCLEKRIKRMGYDDSEIALTALYRAFQEGPICGGTKE